MRGPQSSAAPALAPAGPRKRAAVTDRAAPRRPGFVARHVPALLLVGISGLGVAAFAYPLLLSQPLPGGQLSAHAADAPVLVGLLVPLLLVLLLAELGTRQASSKQIALLGVLAALNAVLRLPTGLGDSPTFFFLPILIGYVFGAQFGFLVGALSLFVSACLTGGIGPWLPFQMFALGWLGLGAAALRPLHALAMYRWGRALEVAALTIYGYLGALAFGAVMNLYFWPFGSGGTALAWQPGLGLGPTLARYWLFYLATSLVWDSLRAIATAALIVVLGGPIVAALRRFAARWQWQPLIDNDRGGG